MALFADYALSGDAYRLTGTPYDSMAPFSLTVKQLASLIDRVRQWGWWDSNPQFSLTVEHLAML